MRLSLREIRDTIHQIDAWPLPDSHPAAAQLTSIFGAHTFFLDNEGLEIVETIEPADAGGQTATVVKLGNWSDPARTALETHEPQVTDKVVEFDPIPDRSA